MRKIAIFFLTIIFIPIFFMLSLYLYMQLSLSGYLGENKKKEMR